MGGGDNGCGSGLHPTNKLYFLDRTTYALWAHAAPTTGEHTYTSYTHAHHVPHAEHHGGKSSIERR